LPWGCRPTVIRHATLARARRGTGSRPRLLLWYDIGRLTLPKSSH
jgi:hypothetical protein